MNCVAKTVIENINVIVVVIGALVTAIPTTIVALKVAKKQTKQNYDINSGLFLIQLKNFFNGDMKYNIHVKLLNEMPFEKDDWPIINDYMGMFEVMYMMLKKNVFDIDTIKDLFHYRIENIIANDQVFFIKLIWEHMYWENFYKLLAQIYGDHWGILYKSVNENNFLKGISIDNADFIQRLERRISVLACHQEINRDRENAKINRSLFK